MDFEALLIEREKLARDIGIIDSFNSIFKKRYYEVEEKIKTNCKCPSDKSIYTDHDYPGSYLDKASTVRYFYCSICGKELRHETIYVGGYG